MNYDHYRINIPSIKQATIELDPDERYAIISTIAVSTHVPIIAVCYFMGELYGFDDRLTSFIERLKIFYRSE